MDLNSLKSTVSNLTLYDIKAGVRKVQNGGFFFISAVVRASLTGLPISGHELHRDGGEGGLFLTRRHRAATRWLC